MGKRGFPPTPTKLYRKPCPICGKLLTRSQTRKNNVCCNMKCKSIYIKQNKKGNICIINECGNPVHSHGHCKMHAKRITKHGSPDKPKRTCIICGIIFEPTRNINANCCSVKCNNIFQHDKRLKNAKEKICIMCGNVYIPTNQNPDEQKYCSRKCGGKNSVQARTKIIICKQCKEEFKTPNPHIPICGKCSYKNRITRTVKRNARRKALRRGALGPTHREKDWQRLLNRYNGKCAYCGSSNAEHRDHVIPINRGGSDSIGNILPACAKCNLQKGTMLLVEWKIKMKQNGVA